MKIAPELEKEIDRLMGGLTSKQCHADELRSAMRTALRIAARICEDEADEWGGPLSTSSDGKHSAEHCADNIRGLMGT